VATGSGDHKIEKQSRHMFSANVQIVYLSRKLACSGSIVMSLTAFESLFYWTASVLGVAVSLNDVIKDIIPEGRIFLCDSI
jgi:hypothetical protein